MLAARAGPPLRPPLRPNATAYGLFRFFANAFLLYVSAHERQAFCSWLLRERSRIASYAFRMSWVFEKAHQGASLALRPGRRFKYRLLHDVLNIDESAGRI